MGGERGKTLAPASFGKGLMAREGKANGRYRHGECLIINGKQVRSTEYNAWRAMKSRVNNPKVHNYSRYGGRGITVDPAWADYNTFLADMGRAPEKGMSIDRIDSSGPYTKDNCRWATATTQNRNKRNVVLDMPQAQAIRRLYATGEYTQKVLAYFFGVTQVLVSQIVLNKAWR